MMASLTGLDAANASLYDGASALAEAILMAVRLHKSSRRVLIPATVHPTYRKVARTIVANQQIELVELPYCTEQGVTLPESLARFGGDAFAALVIPQPNFFGCLERVHELTDWAHAQGALVIGVVNPVALALLAPPGQWGSRGADIAVGEGQPLGVPLSSGGPYFGFMSCKQAHVRQMPGRIVGRTLDRDGKPGFTLTLQAREQHIRRSKATSNICTNQGLAVTAATIHMALLGPQGLKSVALACHANLLELLERIRARDRTPAALCGAGVPRERAGARVRCAGRAGRAAQRKASWEDSISPPTIPSSPAACWSAPPRPRPRRISTATRPRWLLRCAEPASAQHLVSHPSHTGDPNDELSR